MIAGGIFLVSKKIKTVPYTVLLVVAGIIVASLAGWLPELRFLSSFELTPTLLFYVFLPTLIFEAAYSVQLKNFYQSFFSIIILATIGLLVATLFVGFGTQMVLGLFGITVPILALLLFGAIISATDPIAVLSLFKSLGAPKRLALIFEGESLFNDATAVALFLSFLTIIQTGTGVGIDGNSFFAAISLFVSMIVLGALLGWLIGKLFSWLIRIGRQNEMATLTFMLVMAHMTFLLTELASEALSNNGFIIGISPIIATTIASLELGNDGALTLSPKVKGFVNRFWEQLAFFCNSLVFLLVGILVVQQNIFSKDLLIPVMIGVLFVVVARIVSVYVSLGIVSFFRLEEKIPSNWKILLSWASIRGALSLIVVLTLPTDLMIPGWTLEASPRDFILAMTLGAVLASLLGKSITIPSLLRRLKILELDDVEKVMLSETRRFVNILKKEKLDDSYRKGYISDYSYETLSTDLDDKLRSCPMGDSQIFTSVISHYALGVEKYHLEQLYGRGEISSDLFVRIYHKIDSQESHLDTEDPTCEKAFSNRLVLRMASNSERKFDKSLPVLSVEQRFLYYRALAIMARKVVKDLTHKNFPLHYQQDITPILERYNCYKNNNVEKMRVLLDQYPDEVKPVARSMGENMLLDYENKIMEELVATHFTTERVWARFKD